MKPTSLRAAGVALLVSAAGLGAAIPATAAGATATVAGGRAPFVSVDKISIGRGSIPSVLVSFDYACTSATDRLDITLTSYPAPPANATWLKATKAKRDLRCDGARHTDFVEWTHNTVRLDTPARAALSLYDTGGELQVPMAEKTMKPGPGTPPIRVN
ncbi:hypothetical protein EKH77_28035 [Streptomyces luteoverticillatus]|uniref:Secreted protein n=1 Tax=Streptomyces luteoverticillatus TaxID=66425 RepID=A0A3Q9FZW3_STRLT|nr:hypothetical protein [Streptomyces luteoverticillatus]AZQ74550.1 hypothetical protein EKH77_28035 [Streptomyces luteoverticillatus]